MIEYTPNGLHFKYSEHKQGATMLMHSTRYALTAFSLVALLSASYCVYGEEDNVGEDALSSIETHEKRIRSAQIRYLEECIESTKRLIKELERARGVEIRKENLHAANAIQNRIDEHNIILNTYRNAVADLKTGKAVKGGAQSGNPDRIYIWNSFQGNRGVKTIDVELKLNGKLVKELESIELKHEQNTAVRNIIRLPDIEFDEIEIQVMEWHGHSAGLTDIAIAKDKKNLTGKYELTVDHNRANKFYDPKLLIDEDLDTEWFPNDGVRCQINFKLKDTDPNTAEEPKELEDQDTNNKEDEDNSGVDNDGFFGLPDELE